MDFDTAVTSGGTRLGGPIAKTARGAQSLSDRVPVMSKLSEALKILTDTEGRLSEAFVNGENDACGGAVPAPNGICGALHMQADHILSPAHRINSRTADLLSELR